MDVKLVVVESAIKWLVGGELLEFIKDAVAQINDDEMPGAEKRKYVLNEAKKIFVSASSVFIGLAIEIAVILLRDELEA